MTASADSYDFIIVGGGTAGCVLARRLVDTGAVSVLLCEAGPTDRHPFIGIPAGFTKLTGSTHSWGYVTDPQRGLGGKEVWYPQGRVLGGGSSINAQIYTRGNRWDYDNWAAHGCAGWSYDEVLPYFRKSEDNSRYANEYHGQGGPQKVSDPVPSMMTTVFVRAAQQAGLAFNPDFNGAKQIGSGYYQVTNRNGRRCSAASGFLRPVADSKRLCVMTDAHVNSIEIRRGRALAVHVGAKRITAAKEILLTAGAIGSPKVLLCSGVGEAQELASVGIKTEVSAPGVGKNLHDHIDAFCVSECSGEHSLDRYKSWHMTAAAGIQYFLFGTGVASSNFCDGGGFWQTGDSVPAPDVQFHFLPGSGLEHGLRKIRNGVTLNSAYLRPHSRGSVRLRSADPFAKPHVDPNYWGDLHDVAMSVKGFKLAREIMAQAAFKDYVKCESSPGAQAKTDDEIIEHVCRTAKTDYHPVGTCKMGAEDDSSAVVTPELRLKGVERLRVCDSSVMPFVTSSNTYAPTCMIAEKAADMIRAEHKI